MMTMEQIKEALRDRNLRSVARHSGIPYSTILSVLKKNGGQYETVKKLSDYLTPKKG